MRARAGRGGRAASIALGCCKPKGRLDRSLSHMGVGMANVGACLAWPVSHCPVPGCTTRISDFPPFAPAPPTFIAHTSPACCPASFMPSSSDMTGTLTVNWPVSFCSSGLVCSQPASQPAGKTEFRTLATQRIWRVQRILRAFGALLGSSCPDVQLLYVGAS